MLPFRSKGCRVDKVRLLVADDHPMLREGLVAVLGTQPDFEVVGEAADGDEVVRLAARLDPDVILLDLEMPGTDGVEALEKLRDAGSRARTVVFTAYDTDARILGSLRAGARGYLLKGASRKEIFGAIRTVQAGGSLLEPAVAERLLERIDGEENVPQNRRLTSRELEVLALLARDRGELRAHVESRSGGRVLRSDGPRERAGSLQRPREAAADRPRPRRAPGPDRPVPGRRPDRRRPVRDRRRPSPIRTWTPSLSAATAEELKKRENVNPVGQANGPSPAPSGIAASFSQSAATSRAEASRAWARYSGFP